MATTRRSVLVVGLDADGFQGIAPVLRRSNFFSEVVQEAERALDLMTVLPYDAIIIAYPIEGMSAQRFLTGVRGATSACRAAAVLFLARAGAAEEAEEFLGHGVNRVVRADEPAERLRQEVSQVVGAAPRVALRILSRVRVQLALGPTTSLCQTENISSSGMLIRTETQVPIGAELEFELSMPGDSSPIRGRAEVVRQTAQRRERVTGLGVRFCAFQGRDADRYQAHLTRLVQ